MGWKYIPVFAFVFSVISCGQAKDNQGLSADSTTKEIAAAPITVPGAEKLSFTDTIQLRAGDEMKFDKELFRVKAGKKLVLVLINTAKKSPTAMAHNVVILVPGTDIADFAEVAHKGKEEQYVPSSVATLVIAHTQMVSGGETRSVQFTMPKAGVYDFICSYPGHWGTMQGKIVAE